MDSLDRRHSALQRRELIMAGVGATILAGSARAAEAPRPPPFSLEIPAAWEAAPVIPLWPGQMPGQGEYRAQAVPADAPKAYVSNIERPALHVFRARQPNGRAVLVTPGGAYQFVSIANEGVDIGQRLSELGYTAFVLTYRLPSEGWKAPSDTPLQDAQRAMRVIRSRAKEFGFDPGKVAALGFSAGGHLTATLATSAAEKVYAAIDQVDAADARPAAVGLIYPVITLKDPYTHQQSRRLLLGAGVSEALIARRSPELHVDATTPPTFLVHSADDPAVPLENSLMMLAALRAAKRPAEAHIFQEGGHGFGVGLAGTPASRWIDLFHLWLQRSL